MGEKKRKECYERGDRGGGYKEKQDCSTGILKDDRRVSWGKRAEKRGDCISLKGPVVDRKLGFSLRKRGKEVI